MLTQEDLQAIGKLLRPLKEDIEVIKSKVTHLENDSSLFRYRSKHTDEIVSILNEKLDVIEDKLDLSS